MLYRMVEGRLEKLSDDGFPKEKDLQTFVEENIGELLGLKFIATEFIVDAHNRIDTLAYDEEVGAFVVIEDKNVRDRSLVDQGFSYLSAILDRKEKLVLQYNKVMNESKDVKDFDWSQSRIVFISPYFTERQVSAASFDNMPFQLFRLEKHGDTYSWNNVTRRIRDKTPRPKVIGIQPDGSGIELDDPMSEIKVYTENDIITDSNSAYDCYLELREKVSDFPDVEISVMKTGIKFKINGTRFGEIDRSGVMKDKFYIYVSNGAEIKDPTGLLMDISGRKWGNLRHRVIMNVDTDVDSVVYLLRQSYEISRRGCDSRSEGRTVHELCGHDSC